MPTQWWPVQRPECEHMSTFECWEVSCENPASREGLQAAAPGRPSTPALGAGRPGHPRTGAHAAVGALPLGWLTAGQAALVPLAPHLPAPHPPGRPWLWCVLSRSSQCGPDLWTEPSQDTGMGQPFGLRAAAVFSFHGERAVWGPWG